MNDYVNMMNYVIIVSTKRNNYLEECQLPSLTGNKYVMPPPTARPPKWPTPSPELTVFITQKKTGTISNTQVTDLLLN